MIQSLSVGIARATRSWRLMLLLLVANLAFTLPVIAPIFLLIQRTTGGTLTARKMLADKLDIVWMADVFNERIAGASLAGAGLQVAALLAVMGFIYLIVNTLLTGGIIELLVSKNEQFSAKRFGAGCGAYFWRLLRLMLISLLFYGAAFLIYQMLRKLIGASDAQAAAYAPLAYKNWAALAALGLMWTLVNLIFDYAKIGVALDDSRRMFSAAIKAARFVRRNFAAAVGLYLIIGVLGLSVFGLLAWLRDAIIQWSLIKVVIAFLIGQLAIASRIWTRLSFYAAELDFYRRRAPLQVSLLESLKNNFEFLPATRASTAEPPSEVPPTGTDPSATQSEQERP